MMSQAESAVKSAVVNEAQKAASNTVINALETEIKAGNVKTALVFGAVAGVVGGIAWAGLKEEERKKHKLYNDIKLVEENHKSCLTKIRVSPTEEIDLPTVFDVDEKTGTLHVQKDYKTIPELRKMIAERPSEGFPAEVNDEVSRALLNLLIFYEDRIKRSWFWKATEGDVTSAFLRYHIHRLYDYGRKFQGTEYTAAVLNALHESINKFRMQHGIKAERYGYLDRVCLPLRAAVIALKQHKKERSLADIISDAVPDCDELSIKLMHNLTKLVTPTKYWENFESGIDPKLLEENMVRQQVSHTHPFSNSKQINLHPSSVGQNIRKVAANYNVTHGLRIAGMPERVPAALKLKTADFTPEEQKLNFAIFTENSKHIGVRGSLFGRRISNFMTTTTRLGQDGKENELLPITSPADMQFRLGLMNSLAELNDDSVEITKLFLRLKSYIGIEGDEKSADPKNAEVHYMCDVLLSLGAKIRKDADACTRGLDRVELDHQYRTLEPDQATVLMQTRMIVQSLQEGIERSLREITDYRSKTHYAQLEKEIKVHEHETLQAFHDVQISRDLKVPQRIATPPSTAAKSSAQTELPVIPLRPSQIKSQPLPLSQPQSAVNGPVVNSVSSKQPVAVLLGANAVVNTGSVSAPVPVLAAVQHRPARPAPVRVDVRPEMVDQLLTEIAARIKVIGADEFKEPYEEIHAILAKLHASYFPMHGDSNSDRRLKAEKTQNLTYDLCLLTRAFLEHSTETRRQGSDLYANEIDLKPHNPL